MTKGALFALCVFLMFSLSGQNRTYLGIVVAGQMSSSYIEHTLYSINLKSKYVPGVSGGIVFKHFNEHNTNIRYNTGLQLGALYSQKGWKQDFLAHPDLTTRMDYIMVPIDAIVYAGNGVNRTFATLGFFGEWLVRSSSPPDPVEELIVNEEFYTFDESRDQEFGYGLKGELGYQRDTSFGALQLSGYFGYSLSNFIKTRNRADKTPDSSNLFSIGLSMGYFLPID